MAISAAVSDIQCRPRQAAGEELGAEITELCGYLYAATSQLLTLIRQFDEAGYWQQPGLVSCAHWLNFRCGIGMNAAREKVRVARALAELPQINDAFRKGEISYSKVRAMTRVAGADNEDYLLMIARHGTAHHVEKLVSQCRRAGRLQEAEAANRRHARRELKSYYDEDGSLVINARLPAEQGALLMKALEMAMEMTKAMTTERDEARVARRDGLRQGQSENAVISDPGVTAETRPARRADALVEVAESYLNSTPTSASTADRYQVVVHVTAETLQGETGVTAETSAETSAEISADTDAGCAHIEEGPHVTAETSRRIACDCSRVTLIEDKNGEPLSIGRRSRSIPPPMRRALRARDKGCRFPGCTNTLFVDGHHVRHWADGGETSLDNLAQLCRHHHRLVHEGGFSCERSPDGKLVFRDRAGKVLDGFFLPEPLPHVEDPIRWFESRSPDIDVDSATCVSLWAGERMDYGMAVEALL